MKYDNVYVYSGSIFDTDKNGLMDDVDAPKRFEMEIISYMAINSFDIPLILNIHYDYCTYFVEKLGPSILQLLFSNQFKAFQKN